MLSVLANRTYRHLLFAQIVALIGTGLLTVALGLLAFDLELRWRPIVTSPYSGLVSVSP
jgi:hypothetical protein